MSLKKGQTEFFFLRWKGQIEFSVTQSMKAYCWRKFRLWLQTDEDSVDCSDNRPPTTFTTSVATPSPTGNTAQRSAPTKKREKPSPVTTHNLLLILLSDPMFLLIHKRIFLLRFLTFESRRPPLKSSLFGSKSIRTTPRKLTWVEKRLRRLITERKEASHT